MGKRVAYFREFLKNAQGTLAVEFVMFAPVLLAILMVSFEFGRAFWAYDVVTRDLRAAVRYLSRTSVYNSTSKTEAENVARTGNPGGATVHFPWTNAQCTGIAPFAYSETNFAAGPYNDAGHTFRMTANVPITLSMLDFINGFFRLTGSRRITTGYCLTVSYQARYIGN